MYSLDAAKTVIWSAAHEGRLQTSFDHPLTEGTQETLYEMGFHVLPPHIGWKEERFSRPAASFLVQVRKIAHQARESLWRQQGEAMLAAIESAPRSTVFQEALVPPHQLGNPSPVLVEVLTEHLMAEGFFVAYTSAGLHLSWKPEYSSKYVKEVGPFFRKIAGLPEPKKPSLWARFKELFK